MAIAKVEITCAECGRIFAHRKDCHSRKEADQYVAWAAKNVTVCPECYRAHHHTKQIAMLDEKLAECGISLPEISGTSEKQIEYAKSIRTKYLVNNLNLIKKYSKVLAFLSDANAVEAYSKSCAEHGMTLEDGIRQNLEALNLTTVKLMLTATTAREIINYNT